MNPRFPLVEGRFLSGRPPPVGDRRPHAPRFSRASWSARRDARTSEAGIGGRGSARDSLIRLTNVGSSGSTAGESSSFSCGRAVTHRLLSMSQIRPCGEAAQGRGRLDTKFVYCDARLETAHRFVGCDARVDPVERFLGRDARPGIVERLAYHPYRFRIERLGRGRSSSFSCERAVISPSSSQLRGMRHKLCVRGLPS